MAYPTVVNRAEFADTSTSTTHTVPFTQTTGDRVVIFVSCANIFNTLSLGDSFINLTNLAGGLQIIYKDLDGSEGGNVVVTTSGNIKISATSYNIQGYDPAVAPEFSTIATGVDTNPNPGTLTPAGGSKDYLWLAGSYTAGEKVDDDTAFTGAPSSFTNLIQKTTGTTGATAENCTIGSAEYQFTASSLDPGTFTIWTTVAWQSYTVAVSPIVASGPANLKTYNTNPKANIKTIDTNPIANVKTLDTNA